jgi:hypothetical protein
MVLTLCTYSEDHFNLLLHLMELSSSYDTVQTCFRSTSMEADIGTYHARTGYFAANYKRKNTTEG